jgi:hypothetical protein
MFDKIGRVRTVLILAVIVSGLSMVIVESWVAPDLPYAARLTLRSLFWVSAILYFAVRFSGKFKPAAPEDRQNQNKE